MSCGCSGANSSGAGGPLLSTSLDSRFGSPPTAGETVTGDLMSLLSGPGGWIGIALFVVAAVAVGWASMKKESA